MNKYIKLTLLLTLMLPLTSCFNDEVYNDKNTFEIKDVLDRTVRIKNNPSSFVCLGPGALRQYCYIGDTSKLVGIENCEITSDIATKPYLSSIENYTSLPIIGEGGGKDLTNKEALLKVNPDVVFTSYISDKSKLDKLASQTKLPIVAIGYNSNGLFANDIYESLKLIGKITNRVTRANDVVNYFEKSKKELIDLTRVNKTDKTGYVGCVNHRGFHGIDYTTGDFPVFDILGIKNVINEKGITSFAQIEKEALISLQPDVILIDAGGLDILKADMEKHSEFYTNLEAFKNDEVYLELPTVFYSCNFDVALANAYYIGSIFYKDQFKDFSIENKFNEITEFLLGVKTFDIMTKYFKCNYGKLSQNN